MADDSGMETLLEEDKKDGERNRELVVVFLAFVAPFGVLLFSGVAEAYLRAFYALALCGLMLGVGFWVAFRARPEQLVKRWTPGAAKPAWAIFVRICGVLVVLAAVGFMLPSTAQDVFELLSSGRPTTFVEAARGVEGRVILHPVFQTVRLRAGARFPEVYLFAYGGKRLVEGRRYVIAVLPRSHWILAAHEESQAAAGSP